LIKVCPRNLSTHIVKTLKPEDVNTMLKQMSILEKDLNNAATDRVEIEITLVEPTINLQDIAVDDE
jgi:hypothetical protein